MKKLISILLSCMLVMAVGAHVCYSKKTEKQKLKTCTMKNERVLFIGGAETTSASAIVNLHATNESVPEVSTKKVLVCVSMLDTGYVAHCIRDYTKADSINTCVISDTYDFGISHDMEASTCFIIPTGASIQHDTYRENYNINNRSLQPNYHRQVKK